ncbi:hypothetical protein EVAR_37308_1 [Eumeta japonica]|uniref:Uncharacterized protein n=1 Tax=Eumeta variegata TaxID=151549 RepID=A0A4C1X1K0_EUMVA|nr:hypothetical protein EVAR_37308_1 [Eumeta japonica]
MTKVRTGNEQNRGVHRHCNNLCTERTSAISARVARPITREINPIDHGCRKERKVAGAIVRGAQFCRYTLHLGAVHAPRRRVASVTPMPCYIFLLLHLQRPKSWMSIFDAYKRRHRSSYMISRKRTADGSCILRS